MFKVQVSENLAQARNKGLSPPKDIRFDYDNQAWVRDGVYQSCAHPDAMNCRCYGKLHEGERAPAIH